MGDSTTQIEKGDLKNLAFLTRTSQEFDMLLQAFMK